MGRAYYNEIEPFAAQWLRNLIAGGHIAPGDVDERSIVDVRPSDLAGYTQCHFFAGIGGWSLALRLAGWPDDRPVWTGSCPCQPFSAAGKGGGFADERHLWPFWLHLIRECVPPVVFGEQVASKDGLGWLDLVQADLEGSGYACGAVDLCAAGIGAPHIRQRQWWIGERLADAKLSASARQRQHCGEILPVQETVGLAGVRAPGVLADTGGTGLERRDARPVGKECASAQRDGQGEPCRVADTMRDGAGYGPGCGVGAQAAPDGRDGCLQGERLRSGVEGPPDDARRPGPTNGLWRDADWLFCRDGKWRPVEPSTFPLAHGVPGRVGRLRAYGNAIVPQVAAEFIRAYLECRP